MKTILMVLLLASPVMAEEISRRDLNVLLDAAETRRLRMVDGELVDLKGVMDYFHDRTKVNPLAGWRPILGRVIQVQQDGLLVHTFEAPGMAWESRTIFLTNCMAGVNRATDGDRVATYAFRAGRRTYADTAGAQRTVEMWDRGLDADPAALQSVREAEAAHRREVAQRLADLSAKRKAANEEFAIKQLQVSAEGGSHHSQFALGMRYLTGRGVETNRDLALDWLRQAARNGSGSASNELSRIKEPR